MIMVLAKWIDWACPALASLSAIAFSIAYLKSKYKQRFAYALSSWCFYAFVIVNCFFGTIVYLVVAEKVLNPTENPSIVGTENQGVMGNYIVAIGSGASLLLGGMVGIRKPSSPEKEILNIMTPLLNPIEEHIETEINASELRLYNTCPDLRTLPITMLADAAEALLQLKLDEDEDALRKYALRIGRYRPLKDESARLGVISVLLDFYLPKHIKNEIVLFCQRQQEKKCSDNEAGQNYGQSPIKKSKGKS